MSSTDSADATIVNGDVILEKLNRLEAMFKGIQQTGSFTTFNNIVNNTLNININSFGNESMTHLTSDFLSHCIHNPTKGITQ